MTLESDYAAAIPLLKHYLLANPDDAGAHYYLGWCFLNAGDFRPLVAAGEFQTALALERAGAPNSTHGRFTTEQFTRNCFLNLARVHLKFVDFLIENNVAVDQVRPVLDQVRQNYLEARRIEPTAPPVVALGELLTLSGIDIDVDNAIEAEPSDAARGARPDDRDE